jgi:hypothetical protein
VVARVAGTGFRLGRLVRVEERMVNAALETRLASSAPAKDLRAAQEALQGVQGLSALVEGVAVPVDADPVARLLPGIRLVAELVGEVDLPVGPVAALDAAIEHLVIETAIEVEPAGFLALATAAREVEAVLQARVARLTAAVESERGDRAGAPGRPGGAGGRRGHAAPQPSSRQAAQGAPGPARHGEAAATIPSKSSVALMKER